ncbi:G patch domain-containing protein 11 [Macadamia integrifolia]|uniref:G patch domain-containing protein 11 n=1 Tax=Macadamia integrifolia TaxID=60698 RepID=UPI001C4E6235|nr:G patch domain-containing protein 11 [Macadamia integrifolia]
MAETNKATKTEDDEEDYMGDLTQFLPPETETETTVSSKISQKKSFNSKTLINQPPTKKPKTLNWKEQRKIDRERKQREEDEQTLAKLDYAIPQSNIGFKMLKQMGYNPGSALGKDGSGLAEPVGVEIRRSRAGIGREDPHKEKQRREEALAEMNSKKEEALIAEFGSRQKSQWRTRKIAVNFSKAKAALAQLENKEVIESDKEDEEGDGDEEEEEEVEITEEDLQEILMKLRDEHRYCLFCGCQYESVEALLSNCPGTDEDDH